MPPKAQTAAKSDAQKNGQVQSEEIGGVMVNAYGGTAAQRGAELAAFKDDVTKTKRGGDMLKVLQSRKSGVLGLWGTPKPFDLISVASGGSYANSLSQAISLDFHDFGKSYTSVIGVGAGAFSWQRIIGHELGHATFGDQDDGPSRMNNINRNENPLMRELGDVNDRTKY